MGNLKKCSAQIEFVKLNDNCKNNLFFSHYLQKLWQENTQLVIAFGDGFLCELVKQFAHSKQVSFIVVPSGASGGNYVCNYALEYTNQIVNIVPSNAPQLCLIDSTIMGNTSTTNLATCCGQVVSNYVKIIDLIYLKKCSSVQVNSELILKIKQSIHRVLFTPMSVHKTKLGKQNLFITMLNLQLLFNQFSATNFAINQFVFTLYSLSVGAVELNNLWLICAIILFKYTSVLFNINKNNVANIPSLKERITRYDTVVKTKNYNFLNTYFVANKNKNMANYTAVKPLLQRITTYCLPQILSAFLEYRKLFLDGAISKFKGLNYNLISNSLSLASDIYLDNNLLNFIKNEGFLDINF